MNGKFTDHFVITGVAREPAFDQVVVSIRFNTGPRVYEFYIPYDQYRYDKEHLATIIQAQMKG